MSDPTSQPHLPGRPPAWNTGDEPTLPYGIPSQQPPQSYGAQQPPYAQQPAYYEQRPGIAESQPGLNPHEATGHGGPFGPPPDGAPPGYQGVPGFEPQPPRKSRMPWVLAGAIALVVALVGGAGAVVLSGTGGDDTAGSPAPSGSYTDGLASTGPSVQPTETPSATVPSSPSPKPSPTPTEQRRTLKDVDQGIKVYDDVYVNPAKGWRKLGGSKYTVTLVTDRGGVAYVVVYPAGYPAATAVKGAVHHVTALDRLTGVQKGPVKTLRPANSNISSQAQMSFSGRLKHEGVTYSLVGRCTSMTGVESIHNVTVSVCVEARKDAPEAAFRDAARMLASVARSI